MLNYILFLTLTFGFQQSLDDPEIKNLVWNRYITNNFTILSIDDDQGYWMKNNIENIKSWCLTRWGLPDVKFSKECRVFCVPNSSMLKKLFNLDSSKMEIRTKDGSLEITAMWLALDEKPSDLIPVQVSEIIFTEFEYVNKFKFPLWAKKGMAFMNSSITDIKNEFISLSDAKNVIENILNMNQDQFNKLTSDKKIQFIKQSAALILMIRKEFGEVKLHSFFKVSYQNGSLEAVQKVLGFSGYSDFEKTYLRYTNGLSKDISQKTTPDSYLQIKKN